MQIIIDIPEDVYKRTVFYREFRDLNDCVTTIKALVNGTPLPKGHGRLIDADALLTQFPLWEDNFYYVNKSINKAPTIIKADKAESEARNE